MRKSTELSKFLRDSRSAIEPKGRHFYDMNSKFLGVSYSVFVHYETGERIPSPDYLERVAPILKVSARSLCHLWARVHMPSPTLRSFFDGVPGISGDRPVRASPEQQYRFSRSEIPYLRKHPKLWLMCVFLATHIEEDAFSITEMSKLLGLKIAEIKGHFEILSSLGLVIEPKKGFYKSRFREFNLPHDEEFTEIRNNNFNNLSGMVLKSYTSDKRSQGLAQRFTFTCRPSTLNRKIIHSKLTELEALLSSVRDEGEEVCSVVIGYSDIAKRGKLHAEK